MENRFRQSRRVAFVETDASGRVHFSNVLRYVEEAEHALLSQLGVAVWDGQGGWPRAQVRCDYLRPLAFNEVLAIELWPETLGRTAINWSFRVMQGEAVAAEGGMVTVHVSLGGKPIELPAGLRAQLEALRG
jgi:YbgC/YbaW family acyl-CoA thioester hydrolase